ncbi:MULTISPECIES: DUF4326 domain-containing protein [Streptomyces]|uniref:DUF4326 domain-containing protein n=1 Tax=Streptomyces TaxID=1883 RepID=UPI000A8097A5|nr:MULTISPECIES: DUF4326 domain-containing protein [Streptomyces]
MNHPIRVVNKRTSDYDVYIGRGSVWGNPFRLAPGHTEADRARVIAQYETHLLASPELLRRLPELRGKRIACFCAPKPCHGDVLKKYAEALYSHALLVTGSRTWNDEKHMRQALNDAWRAWGPSNVIRPVLISGHCPEGADAMAERLWRNAGFEILTFPADWSAHGKRAGLRRNQEMVGAAQAFRETGTQVLCTAFLDLCREPGCPKRSQEQLTPRAPGHFSHGTIHCRARARAAGIKTASVIHSF